MRSLDELRVRGGCGRQADGTAGLPPVPEIAGAFWHLRFVPTAEVAGRRQIPKDRPNGARAVSFTSVYSSGVRHARLMMLKNTAYPWQ
jgi:hypothetical protein